MTPGITFNIYQRPHKIMTKNCLEYCTYVVREEEADAYRNAGIDDMLVIPKDATLECGGKVHSFMSTLYWIIENTPEDVIFVADDEKLKLLDSYGVAIGDMAKIIGVSYRSVHARLNRIRNTEDNEERLATKEIRENICLMYITNMTEKKGDAVAYVAKSCGFKRSQVEKCLIECHTDGTYGKVLSHINNCNLKVGRI